MRAVNLRYVFPEATGSVEIGLESARIRAR